MSPLCALKVPEKLRNSLKDETFRVYINAKQEEMEIFLTGMVGDEYTQSDAASIASMLSASRGRPVHLRINSFGGMAFDGLAIHNALDMHDGPTRGTIEGVAASAASIAALGVKTLSMHENATYHIHESWLQATGHIADLQEAIAWMQSVNSGMAATYAAKTGMPEAEIRRAMLGANGDGTQYSAADAKARGFVNAVIPIKKKAAAAAAAADVRDEERERMNYGLAARLRQKSEAILTGRSGTR